MLNFNHKEEFEKIINHFKDELAVLRTGRANPVMIENISVNSYGAKTPLKHLGNIVAPDATSLTVQLWDKALIKEAEKAIVMADLGVSVKNEGYLVRVMLPPLTEENRKKLVKTILERQEKAKVALRNVRDKTRDEARHQEKEKEITQDDRYRFCEELDKTTHDYYARIEQMSKEKQAEVMNI